VGSAWAAASAKEKRSLRHAFGRDEVFTVFVRALDYTLAKVELPVFQMYVERSSLSVAEKENALTLFFREFELTRTFLQQILRGRENKARAWLKESIDLRSPMIHPLNLLQLLALEKNETGLLRLTVTGIANGMVATG
jgi:phosphoenolpyruvate carboxylase